MLTHDQVWRALDALAAKHKLSPSALALKAGLSATAFNPSKRQHDARKHWPSTESLARVLQVTNTTAQEFIALATGQAARRGALPLVKLAACQGNRFDEKGRPAGKGWGTGAAPEVNDPHAFIVEVQGKTLEPLYRAGDRLIVSPAAAVRKGARVMVCPVKGAVSVGTMGKGKLVKPPKKGMRWIYRIIWASQ